MAMHRRKGANLRHRRGGALLPFTRKQGGESLPSLAVSTHTKTADVDRWSAGCQDQAVGGEGDEGVGRRGTDALALWVAVESNLVVDDARRRYDATGDTESPVMLCDGESQSASRRTVTKWNVMCNAKRRRRNVRKL